MVDQSDALLDHILSPDFCPQFDIHIDINTSLSSQSTDFSFNSDPLEIDIKDELEKVLLPESSRPNFIKEEHCDVNNNKVSNKNNSSKYWAVKEEVDGNDKISYFVNQKILKVEVEDISHSMVPVMTDVQLQAQSINQVDGRLDEMLQPTTKIHDRTVIHVHLQSRQGRLNKVRRGVSILKPNLRDSEAIVVRKKSLNTKCMMSNIKENLKSPQLKRSSVGSGVSKEHVEKEVKNQQERIRRRDLAMQREKLRNMLPNTGDKDKIGAHKLLENAREYCLELQHKVAMSESQIRFEATWNKFLMRRLEGLQVQSKTEAQEEVKLDNTGVCILP